MGTNVLTMDAGVTAREGAVVAAFLCVELETDIVPATKALVVLVTLDKAMTGTSVCMGTLEEGHMNS